MFKILKNPHRRLVVIAGLAFMILGSTVVETRKESGLAIQTVDGAFQLQTAQIGVGTSPSINTAGYRQGTFQVVVTAASAGVTQFRAWIEEDQTGTGSWLPVNTCEQVSRYVSTSGDKWAIRGPVADIAWFRTAPINATTYSAQCTINQYLTRFHWVVEPTTVETVTFALAYHIRS